VDRTKDRFQVPGVQSQTTDESQSLPKDSDSLQIESVKAGKHFPQSEYLIDLHDELTTSSNEREVDEVDIQNTLFGHSFSPVKEYSTPFPLVQDALDVAINEMREIDVAQPFLDDPHRSSDHDPEDPPADIPAWQKDFQCMHPHDGSEGQNNPNSKTIEVLGQMQQYYERTNDEWRAISYRKAISALKKTTQYISTEEDARR